MRDFDIKTWSLVALITLGLGFEILKHLPHQGPKEWVHDGIRADDVVQPYSVKDGMVEKQSLRPQQPAHISGQTVTGEQLAKFIAQANGKAKSTTFGGKDKGAEGKGKDEKCDPKHLKIDPRTNKVIPCKKKKDAKKEKKKTENIAQDDSNSYQQDQDKSDKKPSLADSTPGGGAIALQANMMNPAAQAGGAPNSLEDWEHKLLTYPDADETKKFIEQYHENLVSADIFYKISQEMIDDSRPEMKKLGVMCLALSPSVLSFQMLAQVYKTEASDSDVRKFADSYVDRTYTQDLSNLSILEAVMRSTDSSYATVLAAQKLDVAATRYLSKGAAKTSGQDASQQSTTATSKYASYFRGFVGILTSLTQSADTSVAYQAHQTLTTLQGLLGTSTPQAS